MSEHETARIDLIIKLTIHKLGEDLKDSPSTLCISGSKALEAFKLIPPRNTPEMDILVFDPVGEIVLDKIMQTIVDNCLTYGVAQPVTYLQTSGGSGDDVITFELGHGTGTYKIDFLYQDELMDIVGLYQTPPGIFRGKYKCKTNREKHARDLQYVIDTLTLALRNGA